MNNFQETLLIFLIIIAFASVIHIIKFYYRIYKRIKYKSFKIMIANKDQYHQVEGFQFNTETIQYLTSMYKGNLVTIGKKTYIFQTSDTHFSKNGKLISVTIYLKKHRLS